MPQVYKIEAGVRTIHQLFIEVDGIPLDPNIIDELEGGDWIKTCRLSRELVNFLDKNCLIDKMNLGGNIAVRARRKDRAWHDFSKYFWLSYEKAGVEWDATQEIKT